MEEEAGERRRCSGIGNEIKDELQECRSRRMEERELQRGGKKQERNLIFPNKKSEARIVRDEWET